MAEIKDSNVTGQSDYDEAAAAEAERIRLERIAELQAMIAELQEERDKYYEARDLTVETINELNAMSDNLNAAVNDLHDCFQINGVNADNGKLDAKIEEIEGYATTLNSQTLVEMDEKISDLTAQIATAATELNGIVKPGESTFEDSLLRSKGDYPTVKSNSVETRATGNGATFLDIDKLNNYFALSMSSAQRKLISANSLVGSITQKLPGGFAGLGTLNSIIGNFDTLTTDLVTIYNGVFERAYKILAIENKGSNALNGLTGNLAEIQVSQGNKAVAEKISALVANDTINATYLSLNVLPNMVRSGSFTVDDLAEITSVLYADNVIGNAELGVTLYELKRTNLRYSASASEVQQYQQELNTMYGYDYKYVEGVNGESKNDHWFKIDSEYEYSKNDINKILKPMYDNGMIDTDDIREITEPLTIFDKSTSDPDIYNNKQYTPTVKDYDETKFQLTVGNRSYQVNDKDRELIKTVPGYEDFFTGDAAYDEAIADVAVSDFTVAVHTVEVGGQKNKVDEANAVGCVALNRTESSHWRETSIDDTGDSIVGVLIREGQYEPVGARSYLEYADGTTYQTVETGLTDAMNGIRNTTATEFRGHGEGGPSTVTSQGGNNFNESGIPDIMADKAVEYTGVPYERQANDGEVPGSLTLPVDLPTTNVPEANPNIEIPDVSPNTEIGIPDTSGSTPDPGLNIPPTGDVGIPDTSGSTPDSGLNIPPTGDVGIPDTSGSTPDPGLNIPPTGDVGIPDTSGSTPDSGLNIPPSITNNYTSPVSTGGIVYTIQPGDTLSSIAAKFGMDYMQIAKDNNIADYNYIIAGDQLVINNTSEKQ